MTEQTARERGWAWPLLAKKAHYFVGGMSLCRKWMYTGQLTDNQSTGIARGPDDCAVCHRKASEAGT